MNFCQLKFSPFLRIIMGLSFDVNKNHYFLFDFFQQQNCLPCMYVDCFAVEPCSLSGRTLIETLMEENRPVVLENIVREKNQDETNFKELFDFWYHVSYDATNSSRKNQEIVRQRAEFSVLTLFNETKPVVAENCHNEYCVSSKDVHKFGIFHPRKLQSKDPGERCSRKELSRWNWSFVWDHDGGVQVGSYRTMRFGGSNFNAKLHFFLFFVGNIRNVMKRSQQKSYQRIFFHKYGASI